MNKKPNGFVLIMALWTLAFLSVLAGSLGVGIRQRINLFSRLETRDKLRLLTESGVRKTVALLNQSIVDSETRFTVESKQARFNNSQEFEPIRMRDGTVEISYEYSDGLGFSTVQRFGIVDEESKININQAPEAVLKTLIRGVFPYNDAQAHALAQAILDWREYTSGELRGFYRDHYYDNLEDPYPTKKSNFETLDELLLVKGVDRDIYKILSRYLTVYGDGVVNINTAPRPVLIALGLSEELADKVLIARRGKDDVESTSDDFVFLKTFDIVSEMKNIVSLTDAQAAKIDLLHQQGKFDTNSKIYTIFAAGKLNNQADVKNVVCVFNTQESKFVYWREE